MKISKKQKLKNGAEFVYLPKSNPLMIIWNSKSFLKDCC